MDRENRQLEYKERLKDYKSFCRAVVAFSNDIGGKIIIGVRDSDLKVIGLDEDTIDTFLSEIPKIIFDTITPYVRPQVMVKILEEQSILEITIHEGHHKPYFIKSEGSPKGVYMRIGAHNKRVTPELMEDLLRESQRQNWDEELTQIPLKNADSLALQSIYGKDQSIEQMLADRLIGRDSLKNELVLSHAGLIFLHPHPNRILPQIEVLYSEFDGAEMSTLRRTQDISGPFNTVLSEILEILKPHLIATEVMRGIQREVESWKILPTVLREVLLNAMIHRKYSLKDAIKIAKFEDRLEIFSPGNFPGPIDISTLCQGISYTRNPNLRQMARKMGLVEKRGLGFRLIFEDSRKNSNPPPIVIEGPDHVKVILRFPDRSKSSKIENLPEEYAALETLRAQGIVLTSQLVVDYLKLSKSTIRSKLLAMQRDGWIQQVGQGRTTQYHWLK